MLGVDHADLFGTELPLPTIAYALTMVSHLWASRSLALFDTYLLTQLEYAIYEWDGLWVDTTFYELEWRTVYFKHIAGLKSFEETMISLDVMKQICVKLLTEGR